MVSNGKDLESLCLSPIDQPPGTMGDGVLGVFAGVEMEVGLEGLLLIPLGVIREESWACCRGGGLYRPTPCFAQAWSGSSYGMSCREGPARSQR